MSEQMGHIIGPQSIELSFSPHYVLRTYYIQTSKLLGAKMPCQAMNQAEITRNVGIIQTIRMSLLCIFKRWRRNNLQEFKEDAQESL
jgi:hypothetical protein